MSRRLLTVIASLAVAGATLVVAPMARGSSTPTTSGHSQADLGCRGAFIQPTQTFAHPPPLKPLDVTCSHVSVDVPQNVLDWTFNNNKTIQGGNDTSMSSGITFSYGESTDGAGNVVSVTVHIALSASVTNGGDAVVNQSFETSFNTNAESVSVSGSLHGDGNGTSLLDGDGSASVDVDCGDEYDQSVQASGGSGDPAGAKNQVLSSVMSSTGECSISVSASTDAGGNYVAGGQNGAGHAAVDLTFTAGAPVAPTQGTCGLKGLVVDGAASDGHQNPLGGIRVQLWRDNAPVGDPVATDATGTYCIQSQAGVTDPGDYKLRATLIDAIDDPPLFETRYATETGPTFVEASVTAADFGGPDKDITFTSTDQSSRISDVANIHYQSERFVRWVIDKLGVTPATFGHVTIDTFDTTGTSTRYDPNGHTVYILAKDSPYSERDTALSEGPENDEWHEISHHLTYALGIASGSLICKGLVNHAGWPNPSTCDSLQEGFSMFLPTLASLEIDSNAGPGYATADYAGFGSLEDNGYRPWDIVQIGTKSTGREDLAIAQLLWDLADDTPDEDPTLDWIDPATSTEHAFFDTHEAVAVGGINLVHLLAAAKPQTVADIYDALTVTSLVPTAIRTASIDVTGDGKPDISQLEQVFLLHGFEPVRDPSLIGYRLGDPVARTDHVSDPAGGLVIRRDTPLLPGSAIEFVNSTASPETFALDVTYPTTTSHFPITVPANASRLVHFEVPPYWHQILAPGAALPACGAKDERVVTLKLSGPGGQSQSLDSCEYLHDAAKATDGAALTFGGIGAAASTGGGIPTATFVLLGVALLLVLALAIVYSVRRSRTRRVPR